jgi:anti-sigma regulatory factor (Ser/Thr protein kinase)
MADPTAIPMLPAQVLAEGSHLHIPSLPNWIEPTVDYLRQKAVLAGACGETRSMKLTVALHEAITNAVIHGNLELGSQLKEEAGSAFAEALAQRASNPELTERQVDIVVDYDGDVCRWIITDQGHGFDVERVLARCTSDDPEVLLASGRGILMMKSFLDDVAYDLGGRRVVLSLARASGKEKRRDSRVPVTAPFQVTPILPDGTRLWSATYEALSRNCSENGIALLQQELAHAGQILIGISTAGGVVHLPAEIKHTRPLDGGGIELGCQFLPSAAPVPLATPAPQLAEVHGAIAALLDGYQARQVPADDRRKDRRVVFNERIVIHKDDCAEPIYGYARDLSRGGIAFIAQEPLAERITITLACHADQQGLKVRCRVVRCARIKEGFYDVGVAFQELEPIVKPKEGPA